jgi:tetratricopeptide (TPR) repeat protein
MTIAQVFASAVQQYQAGNPHEAGQLCGQVLQADPRHVGGLFLLGLIQRQMGRDDLAIERLTEAVRLKPDFAEAHNSLGNALRSQGRVVEAEASYRQALRLNPQFAEAHNNLGVALMERGKLEEAEVNLEQAAYLKPDYVEAHNNLGVALTRQRKLEPATASLRQAIRLKPDYVAAHDNLRAALELAQAGSVHQHTADQDSAQARLHLGIALVEQGRLEEALAAYRQVLRRRPTYADAHNNLGNVLQAQGKLDEAVASYREALRLQPNYVAAHNNLGVALLDRGTLSEAVASFRQALGLQPDFAEAHANQGNALEQQGKFEEAAASYRQAIRIKPDSAEPYHGLGNVFRQQGDPAMAVASFQEAVRLKPNYAEAWVSHALALLVLGNFEQAWPEYEWRWKCKDRATSAGQFRPRWDGSPLGARTILLYPEQGFGDTIQFIRYAPLVKQRGGTVIAACPLTLAKLMGSCPGIDRLVTEGSVMPEYDVQAPLLSLPGLLGTTLATVPANVPYLFADRQLVEQWRRQIGSVPAFKVGIAWQGSPKHRGDRQRSVPLTQFAPLARLEGVRLFSLQKGVGSEQLPAVADRWDVTDLGGKTSADFMEMAAVLRNLDLVVTVDTALAHLAGALGVPVWVAVPFAPDWRWLLGRDDSPWYPSMRLFRQHAPGNWDAVFDRIAAELGCASAVRNGSPRVETATGERPSPDGGSVR